MKCKFVLGIILLGLAPVFSGCGGSEEDKSPKKPKPSAESEAPEFDGPSRDLAFPTDRVVGMLKSRPTGAPTEWKGLGDARGNRKVPAGDEILLDLTGYNITDISFLSTMKPEDIQELILERCGLGNDALGALASLQLKGLNLNLNPVTDDGLKSISGMSTLEKISLGETSVTDAGLAHLSPLTKLQKIWLQNTAITDAGLAHLSNLPELSFLVLYDTAITDAGLDALKSLPKLKRLGLRGTKVTDAALAKLAEFPALEEVDLAATSVTQSTALELASSHPRLRFIFDSNP